MEVPLRSPRLLLRQISKPNRLKSEVRRCPFHVSSARMDAVDCSAIRSRVVEWARHARDVENCSCSGAPNFS